MNVGQLEQQDHCLSPIFNLSRLFPGNWVQAMWQGKLQTLRIVFVLLDSEALPADRTSLSVPSAGVAMVADEGVQPLTLRRFSCGIECLTPVP